MHLAVREAEASSAGGKRWQPLHHAVVEGHVAVAETLVCLGVETTAANAALDTPLSLAISKGLSEPAALLRKISTSEAQLSPGGDTRIRRESLGAD